MEEKIKDLSFIGTAISFVDNILVIESQKDFLPLSVETELFLSNGSFIGIISEIFGPINKPFYSIKTEIEIEKGIKIYCSKKKYSLLNIKEIKNIEPTDFDLDNEGSDRN